MSREAGALQQRPLCATIRVEMSLENTILRFSYPSGSNSDARTFTVTKIGPSDETELYRVRLF